MDNELPEESLEQLLERLNGKPSEQINKQLASTANTVISPSVSSAKVEDNILTFTVHPSADRPDKKEQQTNTGTTNSSIEVQSDNSTVTQLYLTGFDIKDPVELLYLLDDDVSSGRVTLYDWCIQALVDFANEGWQSDNAFQGLMAACNGSGKDKYIIAPCAVWLCMRYYESRCVITSSSGQQLDTQTDTYINQLCSAANTKIAPNIWKINYRYYECLATKSPMTLYATDEPGKAEGFHPLRFGARMGLFVSEDKTVPDSINVALNKCTGYTHRFHVSSPGLQSGHFYEMSQTAIPRETFKESIIKKQPIDYIKYTVTAYDCPRHLGLNYIEQMKRDLPGGETGAAFQSQVLAKFGSDDGQLTVIPFQHVYDAVNKTKERVGHLSELHNTGGLDLADGGDETVLAIRNGNKLLKLIPFKFNNTQDTIRFLVDKFKENHLQHPDAIIWCDAGNIGKPMIDQMKEMGWSNLRYVWNQGKARQDKVYKNKGAEMWFNFGKLLEKHEVWLYDDDKLRKQLSGRRFKIMPNGLHQLESKIEARAKGQHSPDRGDAVVLCFSNYKTRIEDEAPDKPFEPTESYKPQTVLTLKELAYRDSAENHNKQLNPSLHKRFDVYSTLIKRHNEQVKQRITPIL